MSRGMVWFSLFLMLAFVVLLWGGCAALVSSVAAPQTTPSPALAMASITKTETAAPAAASSVTEKPVVVAPSPADEKTLGLTLEQYVKNLNTIGAGFDPAIRGYVGEIMNGPVNDVVQIKIDDKRMINITLARGTRNIKEAMLIGQGDGSPISGMHLMLTAVAFAQAAMPETERNKVGPAIGRLIRDVEKDHDSVHEVVGSVDVWINLSSVLGFTAGVSPESSE